MFVDHLIQYRISSWPKTAEKRDFCTCVTDIQNEERLVLQTDSIQSGRKERHIASTD